MWKAADTMLQVNEYAELWERRRSLKGHTDRLCHAIETRRAYVYVLGERIERASWFMWKLTCAKALTRDDKCKYMRLSRKKTEREDRRIRQVAWLEQALMRRHCKAIRLRAVERALRRKMFRMK